jgi:LysM repeat protein
MYSISQKYGIRLKNLYKLNKMDVDDPAPEVGAILRLR